MLSRAPEASFGLEIDRANHVVSVTDGSPAAQAGLCAGDQLTKGDGKPLQGPIGALLGGSAYVKTTSLMLTVSRTRTFAAQTSTR